ncbi:MAG: class I SAM-dependent methyltransferase [Pseudomonadota bacterium]
MTTELQFWDRVAPKYARKPIPCPDQYARTLERTSHYLHADDEVIELGAGTGTTALKLARRVRRYWATDLSPGMLEIAQEKVWNAGGENITLSVAEPGADAFLGQRADVVLAFNLFHLIGETDAALAHVARMVRPGGYFISKTPCFARIGWRGWLIRGIVGAMRLPGYAPRVTFLSVESWQAAIRAAGFEIVETGDHPATPPSHFVVARRR